MTVKELINKLSEFDENLEVEIISGSGWECHDKPIDTVSIDDDFGEKKIIIE